MLLENCWWLAFALATSRLIIEGDGKGVGYLLNTSSLPVPCKGKVVA